MSDVAGVRRSLQAAASWATWPVVMVGSFVAAAWRGGGSVDPGLWVVVVSAATFVVVVALELLLPAVPGSSLFRDRQSVNDIGHGLLVGGISRQLSLPVTAAVVGLAISVDRDGRHGAWPSSWPMACQVALGLLLWSLPGYWTHRMLHRHGVLWRFHALHHDPERMQVLKGNRIHLGEDVASNIVILLPLVALGAPNAVLVWIALWNNSEGALAHSNIDMRFPSLAHWVLPTPHNHRVHHAADRPLHDSNYAGITPLWDHMFGTFRHPDANPVAAYGLGDGPALPSGFAAQLLLPFRPARGTA